MISRPNADNGRWVVEYSHELNAFTYFTYFVYISPASTFTPATENLSTGKHMGYFEGCPCNLNAIMMTGCKLLLSAQMQRESFKGLCWSHCNYTTVSHAGNNAQWIIIHKGHKAIEWPMEAHGAAETHITKGISLSDLFATVVLPSLMP